jgi:hypothetical protein
MITGMKPTRHQQMDDVRIDALHFADEADVGRHTARLLGRQHELPRVDETAVLSAQADRPWRRIG